MRRFPVTVNRWTIGFCGVLLGSALYAFTPSTCITLPPDPDDPLVVSHSGQWFGAAVAASGNLVAIGAPNEVGAEGPAGAVYLFARVENEWSLRLKILPPPGVVCSHFGNAVAMSGELLVVGAENDSGQAAYGGAVYVFVLSVKGPSLNAVPLGMLRPDNAQEYRYFGCDVAVEDGRIVVGALGDGLAGWAPGAAYVFDWDSTLNDWVEKARLFSYSAFGGSQFGAAVDLQGARVAVGAPYQMSFTGVDEAGAAFVFTLLEDGSFEEQMLASDAPQDSGFFGWSVALDDAQLLVGAPGQHGADVLAGAVPIYRLDATGAWIPAGSLQAADGKPGAQFGYDLAFQNGVAVIGAPEESHSSGSTDEDLVNRAGAVYLFETTENGFGSGTKLVLPSRVPGQRFGFAVAYADNLLAVGAPGCSYGSCPSGSDLEGAAYAFEQGSNQGPTAEAAASETSVVVQAGAEATVTLDGSASTDPDGDALTYAWRDAAGRVIASTATTTVSLGVGTHAFTLQVSDGTLSAEDSVEITVEQAGRPPVADASGTARRVISSNNQDALVRLDGAQSSDPDGDALSFGWFADGQLVAEGITAEVRRPMGKHTFRLVVTDGQSGAEDTVVVRVITVATAVRELSANVARAKLPCGKKAACLVILRNAARSFDHGKTRLGVHELQLMQHLLRARGVNQSVAKPLIADAQALIDAALAR
mgnify:CR=1 FL=1